MKTRAVAETAAEFMHMVANVRATNDDSPRATGSLVITEGSFRFESENGAVENVSQADLLAAIAKRVGLDSIRVEFAPRARLSAVVPNGYGYGPNT